MTELDDAGQNLLNFLVDKLNGVKVGRLDRYPTYKEVHASLKLPLRGDTYGVSLRHQGMDNLAEFTYDKGLPKITGFIVNSDSRQPGEGYFGAARARGENEFEWWAQEIADSKEYDWSPYLTIAEPIARIDHPVLESVASLPELPVNPVDADPNVPPGRVLTTVARVIRDTALSRSVKELHNFCCQVCGETIKRPSGERYAEAHHIRPLGSPHDGPDEIGNMLCLCPNHHAEFDYGVRKLDISDLRKVKGHQISADSTQYHNTKIYSEPRG